MMNMIDDGSANSRVISRYSRDFLLITGFGRRIVGQGFGHEGSTAGYHADMFIAPVFATVYEIN